MYHVLPFQSLSVGAIPSVPRPTALISVCNTIPFLCRLDLAERNDGTWQQIPLSHYCLFMITASSAIRVKTQQDQ